MMMRRMFMAGVVLLMATAAWAEDKFGAAVFPGAKIEAEATKALKEFGGDGACYRTPDGMAKVVEFYKKQSGLKLLTPPKGAASPATVFQKGENIQIRLQSPPAKPTETHICIAKE